ncbi:hypothetical protein VNI00_016386 [Paramarasmius palmivorus]|uniref:Asl1-like glycosyl hydrolase catalytic domain-containing protein n=1 Tax=Paramarasmius palmivorus TaxID=297713 RepID=A0AAW0BEE6_9AGAR
MAAGKLINLVALASLAVLGTSLVFKPVKAHRGILQRELNNNSVVGDSSHLASSNTLSNDAIGSGKVCLAWSNGEDPALANFVTDFAGILYTWSPNLPTDLHGYIGVPMLWGLDQVNDFDRLVKPGYANWVLGMNEPDQAGQSNMSPQDAAALWQQHIQPLASQGYQLVSPACTSDPRSKQWMKDFFSACAGCTFDAIAVHYYDTSADGLIAYLEDFHNTFGKPIWLTEFACQNFNGGTQCSVEEVQQFMSTTIDFMDSTDWVQQYCWFGQPRFLFLIVPEV